MNKTVLSFVLFLVLFCGCKGGTGERFVRSVTLVRPVRMGGEYLKSFAGIVQEAKEISLGFKTAGQIERICVKEGDFVRQGQLVAVLDDADYKLGVEALQIQYDQLEDEVARIKQLYEKKSVSVNDYEKAVAGLRQLAVQLQISRNKLDYTRLCAPIDGYVQAINFDEAEMVDAGTPVIALLDTGEMEVEVDVPSEIYVQRERFAGIVCRLPLDRSKEIKMNLRGITPKADGNQLYRLCLGFEKTRDIPLTAGMNVETVISISENVSSGMFVLPQRSAFQSQGKTFVWVLAADSTVHKVEIELQGIDGNGDVVVSSGLKGDEQVVKAGVDALHEGEKVNVMADSSETNIGGLL